MRKHIILILSCFFFASAEPIIFGGLHNQRYAFIGVQFQDHYGIVFEESLFNQDFKWQHGRLALFSHYELPLGFSTEYILFAGMQYDQTFYNYGSRMTLKWTGVRKMLQLEGAIQPMYDSDLGTDIAHEAKLKIKPFRDIGFYVGERNIPEFRKVDSRFFGGVTLELERIFVSAEISTPTESSTEWTRVGANFIYKSR